MAYIDRDKLAEMINTRAEMLVDGKQAFYYIANWLDKLPTADVVEVVRCKDCNYYEEEDGFCWLIDKDVMQVDFCSWSERKEVD